MGWVNFLLSFKYLMRLKFNFNLKVYDITNTRSFDNISKWLRHIDEVLLILFYKAQILFKHASEDVVKMLLGNKCDMSDRRVVSKERGEKIASDHGINFMETSAKANINVDKAFHELAEAILCKVLFPCFPRISII